MYGPLATGIVVGAVSSCTDGAFDIPHPVTSAARTRIDGNEKRRIRRYIEYECNGFAGSRNVVALDRGDLK
jgi:hypothetical protein